jgi:hypothetical protein
MKNKKKQKYHKKLFLNTTVAVYFVLLLIIMSIEPQSWEDILDIYEKVCIIRLLLILLLFKERSKPQLKVGRSSITKRPEYNVIANIYADQELEKTTRENEIAKQLRNAARSERVRRDREFDIVNNTDKVVQSTNESFFLFVECY